MKKKLLIVLISLIGVNFYAQKLEKVKGSKIVITTERAFDTIKGIELHKNLKINIVKAEENKLVIFADDNLHDIVLTDINEGILDIDLSNRIAGKKKFELTLYLTNLEQVTLNDASELTNNEYFISNKVFINLKDKSKGNLMFEANDIQLEANDHSKGDLLLKGEKVSLNLQESAKLKTGISAKELVVNANQKASIELEGKVDNATITANNSARIKASNFKISDALVTVDDNAAVYINATKNIEIKATGKAKVYLYGNAKINLSAFKGNAILYKK